MNKKTTTTKNNRNNKQLTITTKKTTKYLKPDCNYMKRYAALRVFFKYV